MPETDDAPRVTAGQQHRASSPHGPSPASGKFIIGLFLAALLVNVTAAFLIRSHTTIATVDADESEYWNIATALHDQGLSGIPARRTLPFPWLLASLRSLVGDNYFYVQLLLSSLLAFIPVITYHVVRRHTGNERAAMLAGVGILLWPPFVRYGASIYSDSLALGLFLVYLSAFPIFRSATLFGVPVADSPRRWLQFVLAGALLGLCLQVKPLYLLYTPFAFVLAMLAENTLKRGVTAAVLLTAGCILTVIPWSSYISAREGHFILVSANDGETLAGGLNPKLLEMGQSPNSKAGVFVTAGGRATWVGPGKWIPMDQTGYLSPEELKLPYSQASALMSVRAREWMQGHPGEVAYISARKLSYMWGIYPFWNGASQTLLGNIPLLLLVAVAGLGLWANRQAWRPLALFWTLPLLSSGVALVSWGSWRFRMPADAGLIILVAVAWVAWRAVPVRSFFPAQPPASSTYS